MNILVILRQVHEQKSIRWNYEKGELGYKRLTINKSDMHTLQWATKLSKESGGSVDAIILIKEDHTDEALARLKNFPLRHCTRVYNCGEEKEDARFISTMISERNYDLIVTGDAVEDEQNTTFLPLLAAEAGMDSLTSVHKADLDEVGDKLIAERKEERGNTQIFMVNFPAAISMTSQISNVRYNRQKHHYSFDVTDVQRPIIQRPQKQISEPEPNIWYTEAEIPKEHTPEFRLLNIMGFSNQDSDGLTTRRSPISVEHLHFTVERLMKWLKE